MIATGRTSFHLTYRMHRKDGRLIWVEDRGQFFRDEAGNVSRMVGFVEDVSERMRARTGAPQLGGALRQGVSLQPRRDPDQRPERREDPGGQRHLGGRVRLRAARRPSAARRSQLGCTSPPADQSGLERLLGTESRVREYELELRTKSGDVRQTVIAADTVEMGGEPCFITFIRDVTERKRAEAEAQEQRLQVAHLSRVARARRALRCAGARAQPAADRDPRQCPRRPATAAQRHTRPDGAARDSRGHRA